MDFDDIDDDVTVDDMDECAEEEYDDNPLIGWLTLDRLGDGRDSDNSDDEFVEEEDDGMFERDGWDDDE
jgi:hypothetical protein